jgi:peptidoglycan-associated lipoprotein
MTMRKFLYAGLIAVSVAGCSSTPTAEQAGASVEEGAKSVQTPGVTTVTPEGGLGGAGIAALTDPNNILSKRSVYFDFDSFAIKDEYKSLVDAHARFLASNGKMKMLIQGNTDERGSREYNLALGQKRAEAVKRNLTLLGAREAQIEAVSLGEEKPKNVGHDEAAWADNRRADMLYSGEY